MQRILFTFVLSIAFLLIGLGVGVAYGSQMKAAFFAKVPWAVGMVDKDKNAAFEQYDYPTIKWRAKPLDDKGAIAQLWTRYENDGGKDPNGKMNYKLTFFKAPDKSSCEIQLLDDMGFKLAQFDVSDFHQLPGAADITEARDSFQVSEDIYKKVRDYSIK